ncbi:MAG: hypothetical protein MJ132_06735 [Clostridia bacterium]|nr:hypothetical protein [Clostridia bacterium]
MFAELKMNPTFSGKENAAVLQQLCDLGGKIEITEPGVYDLDRTVYLSSNTELVFGEGVIIRRVPCEDKDVLCDYVFVNRGAFTHEYDVNITIRGMHLSCNGLESRYFDAPITGLVGQLSFFYIKNLAIYDFECTDLLAGSFCIQICTFENAIVENVLIEGKKDGIHFGPGEGFVVRNGRFRTFDDPIALNAHDYVTSNPQLGWIRNGLIENCVDLADDDTVGFFARILAGSWGDWTEGMMIRNSDSVVSDGRIYRACMRPDGQVYTSVTPPTHKSGHAILDGIDWAMVQDENICYNCGCENVIFRNISLQKERDVAFSIHFDDDDWSHSYYPGSEPPIQRNIRFENVTVENKIKCFLFTRTAMDNIYLEDCDLADTKIGVDVLPYDEMEYPVAHLTLKNVSCEREEVVEKNPAHPEKYPVCVQKL